MPDKKLFSAFISGKINCHWLLEANLLKNTWYLLWSGIYKCNFFPQVTIQIQ